MQRVKAADIRKRRSLWENALGALVAAMVFALAGAAHDRGIAQKWVTALFGTLFPFCLVIYLRRRYFRWSFWVALAICLLAHCMIVAAIFQYAFANFQRMSPLLWLPFMLFEVVFLLIVVKRIEEKLTGRRETIKLSF
jgi:hypothetical protein